MPKHVALYARVSSDRQVEEGTIESHLASLHAYVDEQGYGLDADLIFTDDGFSGYSGVKGDVFWHRFRLTRLIRVPWYCRPLLCLYRSRVLGPTPHGANLPSC